MQELPLIKSKAKKSTDVVHNNNPAMTVAPTLKASPSNVHSDQELQRATEEVIKVASDQVKAQVKMIRKETKKHTISFTNWLSTIGTKGRFLLVWYAMVMYLWYIFFNVSLYSTSPDILEKSMQLTITAILAVTIGLPIASILHAKIEPHFIS